MQGTLTIEDFMKELDLDHAKGGAGWDKRTAEWFAGTMNRIYQTASRIDLDSVDESVTKLANYLNDTFHLKLDAMRMMKLQEFVKERLENKIAVDDFQKRVDQPQKRGGLGLDKRTAIKVAREMEIMMLLKFSA